MKSLLFLISLITWHGLVASEELIHMQKQKVWKVRSCKDEGEFYRVVPCFSSNYCEKKYMKATYRCLSSFSCDSSFVRELFKKRDLNFFVEEKDDFFLLKKKDVSPFQVLVPKRYKKDRVEIDDHPNSVVIDAYTGKVIKSEGSGNFADLAEQFVEKISGCPDTSP